MAGRLVASVATLGLGGAMGLEGPSLYLGSTLGSEGQRRLPGVFRGADRRLLMAAGAAAGVSAIFKAPATGAVFTIEVPYQDLPAGCCCRLWWRRQPATWRSSRSTGRSASSPWPVTQRSTCATSSGAAVLGGLAGLGARAFAWAIRGAKDVARTWRVATRVVVAGVALAVLFAVSRLVAGGSLTFGPGYDAITWALDPGHATWLVLLVLTLRCAATVATVGGGGREACSSPSSSPAR